MWVSEEDMGWEVASKINRLIRRVEALEAIVPKEKLVEFNKEMKRMENRNVWIGLVAGTVMTGCSLYIVWGIGATAIFTGVVGVIVSLSCAQKLWG